MFQGSVGVFLDFFESMMISFSGGFPVQVRWDMFVSRVVNYKVGPPTIVIGSLINGLINPYK